MAMMFGGQKQASSRINAVQVNESSYGRAVAALLGQQRVHQTILWTDGLGSWKSDQGGKGGGKGGSQYIYAADVIAGLCNGPVISIADVWDGQSWLSNQWGSGTFTVSSNGVYAPANAALLVADNGVVFATSYGGTYNDLGAPAATVLSGSDFAPLTKVPYGSTLTTGQYSINPISIGTFVLSAAANASGGNTQYTGTMTGGASPYTSGASNAYVGFAFKITGFTNAANNGTFVCTASDATHITLNNAAGVAESHAASAAETGNSYHFCTSDAGKTAVQNYQYTVQDLKDQQIGVVPSTGKITIGGTYNPTKDIGCWYYDTTGSGATMVKMTNVSPNNPTIAGQYRVTTPGDSSTGGATYHFYVGAGGDFNKEVMLEWQYQNNSVAPGNTGNLLKFEFFGGGRGQAIWPFILSGGKVQIGNQDGGQAPVEPAFPGEAIGYSNTAYLAYGPMDLGASGAPTNVTVEAVTPWSYGGVYSSGCDAGKPIVDCNPITAIFRVLTDPVWGLGSGSVPFPASVIDNGASGTWGGASGTPGARSIASTAWNFFASNHAFLSAYLETQDSASTTVGKWLEAFQCGAFFSEGLLKLVPYGTQSAAANGCTWVAPSSVVVALDDTCFVQKEGKDPIEMERGNWQDAYNKVDINWSNRAVQYSNDLVEEWDQASINRYGEIKESPQTFDFICQLSAATFAANMRVKRLGHIRNKYKGTLSFVYSYLEPMDLVSVTTSSSWAVGLNNQNLGLVNITLRVAKKVDKPDGNIDLEFENTDFASGMPTLYNKGVAAGNSMVNAYKAPGNTEVVMFEAPARLTQNYSGNQIWIGAVGADSADWGKCNVWVSQDNTKYQMVGTIEQQARLGVLDSDFAYGSDPDYDNALVVDLAQNCGALESGTVLDADSSNTLCFVDGEIISYSSCTVTGQDQYTMNLGAPSVPGYIRRGQMGSSIGDPSTGIHPAGSLFMRLDSAIYKYTYDPLLAGQTLYFKFQSVNNFGNMAQDLSTLTPVMFTVPGVNPGTISASSGLILGDAAKMDNLADGSTYARVKGTALTSGNVDPSLSGVLAKGSIPPALNGGFTYTSTTSSITWSWPAQTAVYRADGTVTVIGAGSQAITGLTNNGVYEFYPVYDEVSATLKFLGNADYTFPALVGATGDGSTSYITGDTSRAQMGSFSAEVWVKTTSGTVQPLFDLSAPLIIGTTGNKSFHAWFQNGIIQAYALLGSSSITTLYSGTTGTNINLVDGLYHHIVMTWDNAGFVFSVYVDGALAGQNTLANAMTSISTMYWHVGGIGGKAGWTETVNAFYAGTISHAAVYTSVLSLADVQARYQTAVNIGVSQYETIVAAQSPLNFWKLNETTGTAAADSGSAADNGTYRGTVTLNNAGNTFAALGSPAIAYKKKTYAMAQAAANQGRMPLSAGSIEATVASGGSGGGGGSDGSGTCFSPNTKVKTLRGDVPFYDIRHGDLVLTARDTWRRVLSVTGSKHVGEMLDMGDGELVTKGHHFQSNTEWVRVAELGIFPTVVPYDGMIQNLRIEADADDDGSALNTEHSYTLANGHKVHNIMGTT